MLGIRSRYGATRYGSSRVAGCCPTPFDRLSRIARQRSRSRNDSVIADTSPLNHLYCSSPSWKVSARCCFYRTGLLAQLGRLDEAKAWFHRSIELEKRTNKRSLAITLSSRGTRCFTPATPRGRKVFPRECEPISISRFPSWWLVWRNCLARGANAREAVVVSGEDHAILAGGRCWPCHGPNQQIARLELWDIGRGRQVASVSEHANSVGDK